MPFTKALIRRVDCFETAPPPRKQARKLKDLAPYAKTPFRADQA
ncbi:hypothetical protein Z949_854 [Sulfitobacter guttiformis KCTC 32187]|nr:hypothetical protein Z949_854 [Sulfitobacter guttiformis KCTC 32187]